MDDNETICNLLLLLVQVTQLRILLKRRNKIRRRWWVKPHLSVDVRQDFGAHRKLFTYFKSSDHEEFFAFTRMSVQQFDALHDLLEPKLRKRSNREPLSAELRLAVTLSFLAHGDSVTTTAWHFRIGKSTVYKIIPEVCHAMWEVLQPLYLECPQTGAEWAKIADDFYNLWNFPNCIGAIDGRHCRIQAPPNSGSAFHNYKGYFSLVLMGIADAHYRFIWVDIGDYGSINDSGIWANTAMSQELNNNALSIPESRSLPNTNVAVPYCLVGDEGFPLKTYLMRPYARKNLVGDEQRIFNYRLSRARRIVENTFGILVSKWRILQQPLCMKLQTAEVIVQAVTCLHNYVISTSHGNRYLNEADREISNGNIVEGQWRNTINENVIQNLGRIGANVGTVNAMRQRETLAQYFISEQGSIPWQWQHI